MPNVRDDRSPCAFGMTPAREAEIDRRHEKSAEGMVIQSIAPFAFLIRNGSTIAAPSPLAPF